MQSVLPTSLLLHHHIMEHVYTYNLTYTVHQHITQGVLTFAAAHYATRFILVVTYISTLCNAYYLQFECFTVSF